MTAHRWAVPAAAIALSLSAAAANTEAATIYVNANVKAAAGDGTSWQSAFRNLQDALDRAAVTPDADEIWVAGGVYVPSKVYAPDGVVGGASALNTAHLKTFDLPDQVTIVGGFAGSERSRTQRSTTAQPTILSGAGVSWHVVTAGNDVAQTGVRASLERLTISDGNATGPTNDTLFAPFAFNHDNGGGLYVAFDSQIAVDGVRFANNGAAGDGGAIFSINSNLTVSASSFSHNTAVLRAGAIETLDTYEATPHLTSIADSTFDNNSVQVFGGAIVGEGTFPRDSSGMIIERSTFTHNTAGEGGAVVFDSQTSVIRDSRFEHNEAAINAGALATTNVVDTIVNAAYYGAGHPFTKFATTVVNCDFVGNVAHGDMAAHDALFGGPAGGINFALGGGAIVTYMNGNMTVSDSRFQANIAEHGDGGAILNGRAEAQNVFFTGADAFDVQTVVANSSFVGNTAADGNGGAVASLPGAIFTLPARTVANTRVSVTASRFVRNGAADNGGALYLNQSTASVGDNTYAANQASMGNTLYAVDSIINGDASSPVVK